jgi:hypothetical protein
VILDVELFTALRQLADLHLEEGEELGLVEEESVDK